MKGISKMCLTILFAQILMAFGQVNILGPSELVETMKQTGSNGSKRDFINLLDIEYRLGNFGQIPYGKTVVRKSIYK